jgi:hypothetical protein
MPAPKKRKPRATAAETEARVNKVFELLVNGLTRYQVLQFVATKTDWQLKPRQVDNYIQKASALIAQEAEYLRPKEIGKAIARLNAIFQGAVKVQDYKTAIAAQRELNKLLSLYEPPAAQTLNINSADVSLLHRLMTRLEERQFSPSEVFERMLERLDMEDVTRHDDT